MSAALAVVLATLAACVAGPLALVWSGRRSKAASSGKYGDNGAVDPVDGHMDSAALDPDSGLVGEVTDWLRERTEPQGPPITPGRDGAA